MGYDYAADLLGGGAQPAPAQEAPMHDYATELLEGKKAAPAATKPAAAPVAASGADRVGAIADTLADTPEHLGRALRGFWQGATDLPVGLVQLAAKFGPDKVDQAVSEYIKGREADYQASRGDYADRVDLGRFTGSAVASMPVAGKAAAATIGGRMAQGARTGAIVGAATPVEPEADNFGLRKAAQIAGSAAVGGIAPPLFEGLVKVAGAAVNAVANIIKGAPQRLTNRATQDAIEATLTVELQGVGINFADLSRQARDALILETQKALKAGGQIDRKAIARIADFQKLGLEPTRGQVSRDPYQFANERNLGKMELGQPLAERFTQQNTGLINALDDARATTGGVAQDGYEAGARSMAALRASDEVERRAVKAAYDAAKAKVGMEAEVPMEPIAHRLGEVWEEIGVENIPGPVLSRLKEFGFLKGGGMHGEPLTLGDGTGGTKTLTIAEAEKLRKLIGNNMPGQRTPTDAALAPLKQSIDDAVNSLSAAQVGDDAVKALTGARTLASERFKKIESIPALSDMLQKKAIPPEDFVNTYVIRGSVDEVKSLMENLPPGARRDVRAAIIDFIKSKAVSGPGESATFSQAGFNKALNTIGKRNLDTIFEATMGSKSVAVLDQLRRIGRVAADIQKPPVSSGVNYSSSATTIMDMLDKVGRLPVLGAIAGKPGDIVRAQQVVKSLAPAAPVQPPKFLLSDDMIGSFSRSGSVVAPAVGAGIFTGASVP